MEARTTVKMAIPSRGRDTDNIARSRRIRARKLSRCAGASPSAPSKVLGT